MIRLFISPFGRAFGLLLRCCGIQIEVFWKTPFKQNVYACQEKLQCKDSHMMNRREKLAEHYNESFSN